MRIAVAQEGQSFVEGGHVLQWPRGGGKRDVLEVPDDQADWSVRMRANFQRGRLVEVKGHHAPKAAAAASGPVPAGLAARAELVRRAKELGIPAKGKNAELEAAIAAATTQNPD